MLSFPASSMEDGGGLPRGSVLPLVFFPPPVRAAAGPPEPRLAVARLFPVTVAAGGAGGTWPLAFGPVCRGAAKMGRRRLGFPPAAAVELTGGGRPPPAPEEPVEKGGVGGVPESPSMVRKSPAAGEGGGSGRACGDFSAPFPFARVRGNGRARVGLPFPVMQIYITVLGCPTKALKFSEIIGHRKGIGHLLEMRFFWPVP